MDDDRKLRIKSFLRELDELCARHGVLLDGTEDVMIRERQLGIRLTPEESARLERVAKHYGVTRADLLRMLVKREDDRIVVEKKAGT